MYTERSDEKYTAKSINICLARVNYSTALTLGVFLEVSIYN